MENLPSDGGSHREKLILREIDRLVKERDDLRAKLNRVERAEAVKESLTSALRDIKKNVDDWNLQDYVTIRRLVNAALRTAEESSVVGLIDGTPAKQPEVITKLGKAVQNIDVTKRVLVENSCPSEFGLEDCESTRRRDARCPARTAGIRRCSHDPHAGTVEGT